MSDEHHKLWIISINELIIVKTIILEVENPFLCWRINNMLRYVLEIILFIFPHPIMLTSGDIFGYFFVIFAHYVLCISTINRQIFNLDKIFCRTNYKKWRNFLEVTKNKSDICRTYCPIRTVFCWDSQLSLITWHCSPSSFFYFIALLYIFFTFYRSTHPR